MLGLEPAGDHDNSRSVASSRERRRLSIKAAKVERRKQEVEVAAMYAEDQRSKLENETYRVSNLVLTVVILVRGCLFAFPALFNILTVTAAKTNCTLLALD